MVFTITHIGTFARSVEDLMCFHYYRNSVFAGWTIENNYSICSFISFLSLHLNEFLQSETKQKLFFSSGIYLVKVNNRNTRPYVLMMSRTRFRVNPHSILPECQGKWLWVRIQLQSLRNTRTRCEICSKFTKKTLYG